MPRLGHKKSRLGCRQCKARHVKCDELKPCSNCARHGVPCSLVTWDPNTHQPPSASAASGSTSTSKSTKVDPDDPSRHNALPTPSPSVHIDHVPNPPKVSRDESASVMSEDSSPSSQSDHFPFLTRFIHRTEPSQSDLWLRDLELMHHWTIEAFDELSQRDDMRHTWRVDAPLHAVNHPFLMHEILAFSAFHKAFRLPDQRAQYYAFGVHHQDLTIRGMRQKLLNVTAHEAPAIFATSTLLTLSVFASTGFELNNPEIPSTQGPIDGILNIFHLMLGMGNVLALAQTYLVDSFIAPMFLDSPDAIPSQPMLQELSQQIPKLVEFIDSRPDLPELEMRAYLNAIASFESVLTMAVAPCIDNRELHFLFLWPMHLSQEYFGFLRQRRAGAIAILMYYSTMLFAAQTRYWFMQKWGEQLMRACIEKIDEDWRPAVQWPSSFIKDQPSWSLFTTLAQNRHGFSIPLSAPKTSAFAYRHQNKVEVDNRHYTAAPPTANEARDDPNKGGYSQHTMSSATMHNQPARGTMPSKRTGPSEEA